jgi:hypothetical protein
MIEGSAMRQFEELYLTKADRVAAEMFRRGAAVKKQEMKI